VVVTFCKADCVSRRLNVGVPETFLHGPEMSPAAQVIEPDKIPADLWYFATSVSRQYVPYRDGLTRKMSR